MIMMLTRLNNQNPKIKNNAKKNKQSKQKKIKSLRMEKWIWNPHQVNLKLHKITQALKASLGLNLCHLDSL